MGNGAPLEKAILEKAMRSNAGLSNMAECYIHVELGNDSTPHYNHVQPQVLETLDKYTHAVWFVQCYTRTQIQLRALIQSTRGRPSWCQGGEELWRLFLEGGMPQREREEEKARRKRRVEEGGQGVEWEESGGEGEE